MKRLWQWWTLENVTKAADLGLKLAGMLAVIAALNIFVVKPDVDWNVDFFDQIDLESVKSAYLSKGLAMPINVAQAIEQYNYQRRGSEIEGRLIGDYFSEFLVTFRVATTPQELRRSIFAEIPVGSPFLQAAEAKVPQDIQDLLEKIYGSFGAGWGRGYVRILVSIETLSKTELEVALQAIESSMYLAAVISISNAGEATARAVNIVVPPTLSLEEGSNSSFDLPPGATQIVFFRSQVGDITPPPPLPGIIDVIWEPTIVVNTLVLSWIGVLFAAIWMITTIKNIWEIPRS